MPLPAPSAGTHSSTHDALLFGPITTCRVCGGFPAKPPRPSVSVRASLTYGKRHGFGLSGEDLVVGIHQFDQYLVRARRRRLYIGACRCLGAGSDNGRGHSNCKQQYSNPFHNVSPCPGRPRGRRQACGHDEARVCGAYFATSRFAASRDGERPTAFGGSPPRPCDARVSRVAWVLSPGLPRRARRSFAPEALIAPAARRGDAAGTPARKRAGDPAPVGATRRKELLDSRGQTR
jgi:hypothetical protein